MGFYKGEKAKRGRCLYCGQDRALAMGAGYRANTAIRQHDDPKRPGKICRGTGLRPLDDGEQPREPFVPEGGGKA